jgi:polysaccharide chain length determinant protein (PEP-CTERM system associated)
VLPDRTYTWEDMLRIAVRRRWLVLVPFAIGLALVPTVAELVPERFTSEALLVVMPQRVPEAFVRSTVAQTMAERLPTVSEEILSRSNLERIIRDLDPYPAQRSVRMEDLVRRMRGDIEVTIEGPARDAFRLSYVNLDPEMARRVTDSLATLYREQNLRERESVADSMSEFLEAQLEDARGRLLVHEQKLEEYRREHAGQLPSQLQGNLQAIQTAQMQLQVLNESMNRTRERRLLIERQIADAAFLGPAGPEAPATTAQQLESTQAELEAARLRYTGDHPDVRRLERTVRDLQAKLTEEIQRPAPATPGAVSPPELARDRRVRELQAELDIIDRQLATSQSEGTRLRQTIATYQARVDVLPTRESELVELTRDYDTLQAAYAGLLAKREESQIAANLERGDIGEQFRIIDAASRPETPSNGRELLAAMAAAPLTGLLLGCLLVGFLEYRDATLRREDDVRRLLAVPVLALFPVILSRGARRRQQWRAFAVNAAGLVVVLGAVAVVVRWGLQP